MGLIRPVVLVLLWGVTALHAQQTPLEYRVKAAFLINFAKFVEWPAAASSGPLVVCVAEENPFGPVLSETVAGERINGREIEARFIAVPESNCHILFVPRGIIAEPYIRAAVSGIPTLTVGEDNDFLRHGGIINFIREGGNIRFVIDAEAANEHGLRISSRLLRLARPR